MNKFHTPHSEPISSRRLKENKNKLKMYPFENVKNNKSTKIKMLLNNNLFKKKQKKDELDDSSAEDVSESRVDLFRHRMIIKKINLIESHIINIQELIGELTDTVSNLNHNLSKNLNQLKISSINDSNYNSE